MTILGQGAAAAGTLSAQAYPHYIWLGPAAGRNISVEVKTLNAVTCDLGLSTNPTADPETDVADWEEDDFTQIAGGSHDIVPVRPGTEGPALWLRLNFTSPAGAAGDGYSYRVIAG